MKFLTISYISLSFITVVLGNPDWNKKPYHTEGILYLADGQIAETFEAWIDNTTRRSRIDYYHGINTIIYNDGFGYKLLPHVQMDGLMNCYNVTGSLGFQHMLPNISGYRMVSNTRKCEHKGVLINCTLYSYTTKVGNKLNTYDMFVHDNIPLHYNFTGYDVMMESHYDHYIFVYTDFQVGGFEQSVFDIPERMDCFKYPNSDGSKTELDPMVEFMGSADYDEKDKDTTLEFEMFKKKYSKKYDSDVEHESRKSTFRQARRYIHSKNRQNLGYKLAINHLSDQNKKELKLRNGYRYSGIGESHRLRKEEVLKFLHSNIPGSLNWTDRGAVNPPKDQGTCGAGWSFASTGALEGSYFLKHNKLLDLSEQCLIDCTWDQGNRGCDGGEGARVGEWLVIPGICEVTRESYKDSDFDNYAYMMADRFCHWPATVRPVCATVKNYTVAPQGDIDVLRELVANVGPIQVAIDASHLSFSFYSSGVYYEENCANTTGDLDHSVLLVGYGRENGQDYWLIKNSWSTYWGDLGYIKMSTKNNNCGVATDAVFFTLA